LRLSLPSPALVVACLALLFALGGVSYAATGSLVNIVDSVTATYKAHVDPAGKLYVGDGSGPLTVDGVVTGRPAAPVSPWRASEDIQNAFVFIAGPSSVPINLTSLSISTDASSGQNIDVFLYSAHVPSTATSCSGAPIDVTLWHIRDIGDGVTPISFSFPTPLQDRPPANTKACLEAYAATPDTTTMNAVGFYGG
jgi:hypothetical protein